jgi:hypothetical protein
MPIDVLNVQSEEYQTPQAYFELDGAYLVEYSRGNLAILPMPTMTHQRIASRLYDALLFAGTRVKV